MRRILVMVILLVAGISASSAMAKESLPEIFERTWATAKENIYPGKLAARFDDETFRRLRGAAERAGSLEGLATILNRFLTSLGVSHTYFYQEEDPDYHFMRSLFGHEKVDARPVWHIGLQGIEENGAYRLREVLDGLPAYLAGLRRGDLLLRCGPEPFHPLRCFRGGRSSVLNYQRNGQIASVKIRPVYQAAARSFLEAMKSSARVIEVRGRRIGYVHFWMGGFEENIRAYHKLIESMRNTDGFILDLRGGFGGASLERVDPFYADRSTYPKMSGVDREGKESEPEDWEPRKNERPYERPLVVLINEGTRSGKEMMAYQFAKGRGTLVGSRTAGMFVGGRLWFGEENKGYALYLASMGALLDGVNLEGVGVAPAVEVPYPIDHTPTEDPQLRAALQRF